MPISMGGRIQESKLNKTETAILRELTEKAFKQTYVLPEQKQRVSAMEKLEKAGIIQVMAQGHSWDFVYSVNLNLPAYVCEDCESKYNARKADNEDINLNKTADG